MKTTYFSAVRKGTLAGKNAGELQKFIEKYVQILFPEDCFEWWDTNVRNPNKVDLKPDSILPSQYDSENGIHHFACYVREGNESEIVEVAIVLRNGSLANLMTGKLFARREVCWQMCDAIDQALRVIFHWEEIPQIVDISAKVPRQYSYSMEASIAGPVSIEASERTFSVKTQDGTVLDQVDFSEHGESAKWAVAAYADDWKRVLTNSKLAFVEPSKMALAA